MPIRTLLSDPPALASSAEDIPSAHTEHHLRRSLLLGGLHLLFANKRLILWTWCASLLCGLLATLPVAGHVGNFLNHSLAAQEITGRVDLSYIAELLRQAGQHGGISATSSLLSITLFALLNVVLAAGAFFVFQSGASPRLSVVVEAGLKYFWRFIRLAFIAAVVIGLTVWLLTALREAWLTNAGKIYVGQAIFLRSSITLTAIFCIALLLRFYFDLAEAVLVQFGIADDRRVRRSLSTAARLLRGNFLRSFLSYFLIGSLGVALFVLSVWIWVAAVSPYSMFAFALGQLGIIFLLGSRLWQRATLASLVIHSAELIISPIPDVPPAIVAPAPTTAATDVRGIW